MRRLVLTAALVTALVFTAFALAAPHSGKWRGRVLADNPGQPDNGLKVNYGYSPDDHPSVVRFSVAKGGHKIKGVKVTVPLLSCGGSGPPVVPLSIASVKIKSSGKFSKTSRVDLGSVFKEPGATVKFRGTLSESKGSGKLSVHPDGGSCTHKFKFKLKH